MKYWYYALTFLCLPVLAYAQNVGIGTSQPTQALDVNGGLRVCGAAGAGTRRPQAAATGSPVAATLPAAAAVAPALTATVTGLNNPLVCVTSPCADPSLGVQFSVLDVSSPASPAVAATVGGPNPSGYTGNPRPLARSPGLVTVLRPPRLTCWLPTT